MSVITNAARNNRKYGRIKIILRIEQTINTIREEKGWETKKT